MQRLFSMFPEGGPGAGLLLLRLSVALSLLLHPSGGPLVHAALALTALGLCLGVLTPLLAIVCGLFSFYDFLSMGGVTLPEASPCRRARTPALMNSGPVGVRSLFWVSRFMRFRVFSIKS
ncbi:hypothetical protein [Archangium violaceum]|uniref:hypothetical protein n=1 Tax=Archangium violaceum TaxID=83451 RepID=UPI0005BBA248|nr:hypothetical protein [Archangium violaceum]